MDRELVLAVLLLVFGGVLLFTATLWSPTRIFEPSARSLERCLWRRLWFPLLGPALAFSTLLGWAVNEPEQAEGVPVIFILGASLVASIWLRALVRAGRAVRLRSAATPIATVGLLRPRVVVSRSFANAVDDVALDAACKHEAAHARHRDPLRIWLAQLGTDLQWPSARARARFQGWLEALEMARDEEARLTGAEGADLASAIIVAVRLCAPENDRPLAAVAGTTSAFKERIERLLIPLPKVVPTAASPVPLIGFVFALASAAVFGATFGEPIVKAILTGQL